MRFGSILDLFKKKNWSNELVGMVDEMLSLGQQMFDYTMPVLTEGAPDSDPQALLYDRDLRINRLERRIRRRVVTHMSMNRSQADVPSALIFTNVVKDGERIGDYIKNLHEVRAMMPAGPDFALYKDKLGESMAGISALFEQTRHAFNESDEATAGQVIKGAKDQGRNHEKLIREITTSQLPVNDAVCLVLILRFFKRLAAHMSNIASTVVMPVDMIDFYDEPETD